MDSALRKLRARVERLLGNNIRTDDLTYVLTDIRNRSFGREWIREIGHCIAHPDKRDRGIVTRSAEKWLLVAKYYTWVRPKIGKPADLSDRPPFYLDFLDANFELMGDRLTDHTGLKSKAAKKLLSAVKTKFVPRADGNLSFSGTPTAQEYDLLRVLSTLQIMQRGYDATELFKDFVYVLQRHGVLKSDEDLKSVETPLGLFALSKLHLLTLDLKGENLDLQLSHLDGGPLNIIVDWRSAGHTFVPAFFFGSKLRADQHCVPDLLVQPRPWDFPIELNQNGKLQRLG